MDHKRCTSNPYTPASSELFYGRSTLMRKLLENEQAGQSVVLLGGRRCGKTVLLRRMQQLLLELAMAPGTMSDLWHRLIDTEETAPPQIGMAVHLPVFVNYMGAQVDSLSGALNLIAQGVELA